MSREEGPERISVEMGDMSVYVAGQDPTRVEERFEWVWKLVRDDAIELSDALKIMRGIE